MTPHITDALFNLRPGASFQVHGDSYADIIWLDEEQTQPSEQEVLDELTNLLNAFNAEQYKRDRVNKYPSIADQLDMLYHDIKSGALDSGAWIQAIETVKQEYPKP